MKYRYSFALRYFHTMKHETEFLKVLDLGITSVGFYNVVSISFVSRELTDDELETVKNIIVQGYKDAGHTEMTIYMTSKRIELND